MRVRFSRTLRLHFRDDRLYTASKTWTERDSYLADHVLTFLKGSTAADFDEVLQFLQSTPLKPVRSDEFQRVWDKLQTWPHIFEVAAARGTLSAYTLQGDYVGMRRKNPFRISLSGGMLLSSDLWDFQLTGKVSEAFFDLVMNSIRSLLTRTIFVHYACMLRSQKAGEVKGAPTYDIFPYLSRSRAWSFFLLDYTDLKCLSMLRCLPTSATTVPFEWATNYLHRTRLVVAESTTYWSQHDVGDSMIFVELMKICFPDSFDSTDLKHQRVFAKELRDAIDKLSSMLTEHFQGGSDVTPFDETVIQCDLLQCFCNLIRIQRPMPAHSLLQVSGRKADGSLTSRPKKRAGDFYASSVASTKMSSSDPAVQDRLPSFESATKPASISSTGAKRDDPIPSSTKAVGLLSTLLQRDLAHVAAEKRKRVDDCDLDAQARKVQRLKAASQTHDDNLRGETIGRLKAWGLPVPMNINKIPLAEVARMHRKLLPNTVHATRDSVAAALGEFPCDELSGNTGTGSFVEDALIRKKPASISMVASAGDCIALATSKRSVPATCSSTYGQPCIFGDYINKTTNDSDLPSPSVHFQPVKRIRTELADNHLFSDSPCEDVNIDDPVLQYVGDESREVTGCPQVDEDDFEDIQCDDMPFGSLEISPLLSPELREMFFLNPPAFDFRLDLTASDNSMLPSPADTYTHERAAKAFFNHWYTNMDPLDLIEIISLRRKKMDAFAKVSHDLSLRFSPQVQSISTTESMCAVTPQVLHSHLDEHEVINGFLLQQPSVDAAELLGYSSEGIPCVHSSCGLRNIGNTCWGNALLQVFARISPLQLWMAEHSQNSDPTTHVSSECPLCLLSTDLKALNSASTNSVLIPDILQRRTLWNADFNNCDQQDAHEAFCTLLQAGDKVDETSLRSLCAGNPELHDAFHHTSSRYTTPFWKIFGGLQRSITKCSSCQVGTQNYEMFHNVCLAFPCNAMEVTLESMLGDYLREEPLEDICRSCGASNCRTKSLEITRWPRCLAVQFQRFETHFPTQRRIKIARAVHYPVDLRVCPALSYNLRGVILHTGTFDGGHYTAIVEDGHQQWHLCDDAAEPKSISASKVVSTNAYMLFYEQI